MPQPLSDPPAERLRHRLVAKANADHLPVGGPADELEQVANPGQGIVNAGGRSGDQIGVIGGRVRGQPAGRDIEGVELEIRSKHALEHGGIVAEAIRQVAGRTAGLEDCELHVRCLATSERLGQCSIRCRGTTGFRAAMR